MQSESRWSARFGTGAIVLLLTTVCLLPWIHGGNIPLARLVLQAGSIAAGLLSLISCVLRNERSEFPRIIFPLGVLFAVGVIQLIPVHAPMVSQMSHAVLAELRPEFARYDQTELTFRTASPGDTRMVAAQLVALMLLAITAFDQIRTRRSVICSLAAFTANASVLSLLAILQSFQSELFLIRDQWWSGIGGPLGTFVNPNNAAGWLTLGLASAIGLLVLQLQTSGGTRYTGHDSSVFDLFIRIRRHVGSLTPGRVLVWLSVALIVCAIAATNSRGGMMAAIIALVAMLGVRLQIRRLAVSAAVVLVCGTVASGLMVFLNLHRSALEELRTLRDPAGEMAGRVQHWQDSLRAVLDFPVLGGGLGAYRYTTLPYQTKDLGVWSQNADNQYLEMLVEAGVIGCVAFVMLGLPILIRAVRVVRLYLAGAAGRSAAAIALVLVFATVSQAMSAVVDFGTALPASSSLFVVLTSMLAAVQDPALARWFRPSGPLVAVGMRFVLLAAAVLFARDLSAAHDCYLVTIEGRKIDDKPGSWEAIRDRERLLTRAGQVLEARVDDARTQELVSRLRHDLIRSEFLRTLPGIEDPEQFQRAWPYTSCVSIARRINSLSDEPDRQQQLTELLRSNVARSGVVEQADQVLRHGPLPAPVVRRVSRWVAAIGPGKRSDELQSLARFIEPANGELGLELGELNFLNGRLARAVAIWKHALKADESLRYWVLAVYLNADQLEAGLEIFGPTTYSQAVTALVQSRRPELTEQLRHDAASLWTEPQSIPSTEVQRLRNDHLRKLGDLEARIEWLEQCVSWEPDTLRYRQDLALAYSQAKRWIDSENQWYEVLRLDAGNRSASRGIAAIREKRRGPEE